MTQATNRHAVFMEHITRDLWALEPGVLQRAVDVFGRHVADVKLTDAEIREVTATRDRSESRRREYDVMGGTAIIPITGVIAKLSSSVNGTSQPRGTATQAVSKNLARAIADPDVERIMLLVDSPGGQVAGVADLAAEVRAAAKRKPLTAYIEDLGASAAYWIVSGAAKIYANASAAVGSIGVYAVVADASEMARQRGLTFHVVKAGEFKGAGTPGTEVTDDQLAAWQERIDDVYGLFVGDVEAGRQMKTKAVEAVADGRVYTGAKAKANGLVDAITDFRGALKKTARVAAGDGPRRSRAEMENETMTDETTKPADETADDTAQVSATQSAENDDAVATTEAAIDQAKAQERERAAGILAALDGFPEVAQTAIADGLTVDQAKAAAFDQVVAQRDDALARLSAIETAGVEPADVEAAAEGVDLTADEKADQGIDDGKAETYQAAIDALCDPDRKGGPLTKAQAHRIAAGKLPESFQAWNDAPAGRADETDG